MAESADTSASAGSNGAKRSSPVSSAADPDSAASPSGALRVDFYVLEAASAGARLKLACRLAEKAYLMAQSALIWHTDARELAELDEMLWTFMDGSFVPHDTLVAGEDESQAPVMLSAGIVPQTAFDVVINLAPSLPQCLAQTRRVAEIIDGDDGRRRAGRARFKAYRELGIQPASHNVRED